jgi:hypothetical protein
MTAIDAHLEGTTKIVGGKELDKVGLSHQILQRLTGICLIVDA